MSVATIYVLVQRSTYVDGSIQHIPVRAFAEKADAMKEAQEVSGRLAHMMEWEMLRPNPGGKGRVPSGVQFKTAMLQMLGLTGVGFDVGEVRLQDGPKIDVVPAGALPGNVSPLILKP